MSSINRLSKSLMSGFTSRLRGEAVGGTYPLDGIPDLNAAILSANCFAWSFMGDSVGVFLVGEPRVGLRSSPAPATEGSGGDSGDFNRKDAGTLLSGDISRLVDVFGVRYERLVGDDPLVKVGSGRRGNSILPP